MTPLAECSKMLTDKSTGIPACDKLAIRFVFLGGLTLREAAF